MFFQKVFKVAWVIFVLFLIFITPSDFARAAKVLKVKGRKVLIDREGESLKKGDLFYIISSSGKKRGVVKILKVKGSKAIAKLGKRGKARRGWTLRKRGRHRTRSLTQSQKNRWGVLAGLGMHSMSVKIKDRRDDTDKIANMSGNGFNLEGLFDYRLSNMFWFRGLTGFEQFAVSSSDEFCAQTNDQTCDTSINYLSIGLWARLVFNHRGTFLPWVGAGSNLLHPLSNRTTAIDKDSIITTHIFALGGGFDWVMGNIAIPFQVEYGGYPSSDEVEASSIVIKTGISFPF